ncbi:hypothetical protein [Nitrosopumilus sp.]|uniref:hypothetical protein n=1 Tax=Nitrosopumilus sp. TaxID=2024843 RepID=UPI00247C6762|nr:hypothetical protein [Nitrosopumilus sp.]MCV0430648.1 hypothetical protein [Nitrosopumilus sp.]
MPEWWEYIPVVSTLGHAFQEPPGTDWADYNSAAVTQQECQDPANAKILCEKRIDSMMLQYIASYVGVSLPADFIKTVGGLVMAEIIKAILISLGKKKAAAAALTGPFAAFVAIDGFLDLGAISTKIWRIYDAANDAKSVLCRCG